VQVQLHQGTLNVHIRKLYGGEVYEIDSPNQAFTVTKSGEYRFDVDPNGDTTLVTVWKGEGEATGQGQSVRLHEGQQARFYNGNSLAHQINPAPAPDGFDDWCKVRDKREDESVSARYVAPGVVGASDLDEYGHWRDTPDYGNVWVPDSVPPGWAPYSAGHWIWQPPYGWTWVDDAPWGFAPFHYGRWVDYDDYWGWAPGPYWVRPWYAPALVAWFGGPHFGIGFGWGGGFGFGFGGGFGWCALGFGEPFFPWYGGSRGYFRNVNISNTRITNINNITNNYYNNRNGGALYGRNGVAMPRFAAKPGALTAVSRNTLERGLPVASNRANIPSSALRNLSSASIARPSVSPTRSAMLGPKAGLPAAHPSAAVASRPTVSRMTPPANSSHSTASPRSIAASPASRGPQGRPSAGGSPAMPNRTASNPATTNRNAPQMAMNRNVPRPPQSSARSFSAPSAGTGARPGALSPSNSPASRSVPRPPAGGVNRPTMSARNTAPNMSAPRSYGNSSVPRSMPNNVPRPSGHVLPAPRNYPSAQSRGGYSTRAYGGGYGGYGGYRGYSGSPYGGSFGRGSYGGRSYSAPSSHGSFGGGYHGSSGSHGSFGGGSHGGGGGSHGGGGGGSHGGGGGSHGGHR